MSRQSQHTALTTEYVTLTQLCNELSISLATGRNWIKLGKIIPDSFYKKTPLFSKESVKKFKKELISNQNKALKSRRNKAFVTGNQIYKSYIDHHSPNYTRVQFLLKQIQEASIEMTEQLLKLLLADCAVRLLSLKFKRSISSDNLLSDYLHGSFSLEEHNILIDKLIGSKNKAIMMYQKHTSLFAMPYTYQSGEDLLGLLYLSLKGIGSRKATGSYYTPTQVVKSLIKNLTDEVPFTQAQRILDPCCGTGNFLIQLPDEISYTQVYGNDIDKTSVLLTRINVALHFKVTDVDVLLKHITLSDYLRSKKHSKFDIILGNPPWGYIYSTSEKNRLRDSFLCATGKSIESFDLFIEQSLRRLVPHGRLSFVLPEAILTVKSHQAIRSYMMQHSTIKQIHYLGETFDKVQCPSIILHLEAVEDAFHCKGMKIITPTQSYVICEERNLTPEYFSFLITDKEYQILDKMQKLPHVTYLKDQADFALGIVSGNNQAFLSEQKQPEYETILKGSDIQKYRIVKPERYIHFSPKKYQQVAPVAMYRASEKLLYRFISDQLILAYDSDQHVTLNSCNIVIPHIDGLHIKYILAILNSSIAQFYFQKQFHSVKVLRSHIEHIPIPYAAADQQQEVILLVDSLLTEKNDDSFQRTYKQLDQIIASLYELSEQQYQIIVGK